MQKHNIIGSIDLGSNQVVCIIGRLTDSNSIEVLGAGRTDCKGIKNGVIINMAEASNGIRAAIEQAEEKAGYTLRKLYVALRGNHITSHNSHGTLGIARTDKEITAEDVESVIENAKMNVRLSPDKEIIHAIPQNFSLNNQTGVPNPIGMDGSHLEVNLYVVTAASVHINNIQKTIAKAGFEVIEFVYGVLALGENVVTQEEKDLGCALIDIGASSTGIVVYRDGTIQNSREIELGSDFISKDLAHYLKTKIQTATSIKEKYGAATKKILKPDEANSKIEYISLDGKTKREVKRQEIITVIEARVDQIASYISDELNEEGFSSDIFAAGVILSGGGSQIKGIDTVFEDSLKTSARIGNIFDVVGESGVVDNPTYYTAISLLKYHFGDIRHAKQRTTVKKSFFSSFLKWWDEIF